MPLLHELTEMYAVKDHNLHERSVFLAESIKTFKLHPVCIKEHVPVFPFFLSLCQIGGLFETLEIGSKNKRLTNFMLFQ